MKYPYLKIAKSKRVCGFHGLPTKGNAFIGVSREIDEVFIYGSLMKDSWERDTAHDKRLRKIKVREIGQCKTDKYFIAKPPDKSNSTRKIVIAPSFEACSLLHTYFEDICSYDYDQLSGCEIVFKPHPASLKRRNNQDPFFREDFFDLTKLENLQERIGRFKRIKFILDPETDLMSLLSANSVLITDYSGIAFDALLLKVPVIYLFNQAKVNRYFSHKYHIDYNVTGEFIESGGASRGYKVENYSTAIDVAYQGIGLSSFYSKDFPRVVNDLLYNPGQAIVNTTEALYETN
ncbi:CDP-glycerol glycerophosphotransferase family protein [Akkermansiaceae bacterium]|nr:CDP-glycerol glycerophosphotransferase family protein [Akkermansiaceae bacterium]